MPVVNYLHTIVESEYWKKEQWQKWADELIINHDKLEDWIYDVAFANDKEELCLAIAHEKITEVFDQKTNYSEPDVIIGYYYLMFQEKRMNLSELFLKLTDEDDISGEAELRSFSETKSFLNSARMGKVDYEKMDRLLCPLARIASKQLNVLESYLKRD